MEYYLPPEIQKHINEYVKPLTRPDWRKGSYIAKCNNHIKCIGGGYYINVQLNKLMNGSYMDNLIPNGKDKFDEDHYIYMYKMFLLDKAEWD